MRLYAASPAVGVLVGITARLPVADLRSFWGALGCACWAV
jgi:hypothetical protein